jgi:hypothetical protein
MADDLFGRLSAEARKTFIDQNAARTDVATENLRQLAKWGTQDHHDFFWFLIELEEMGEVAEALLPDFPPLIDTDDPAKSARVLKIFADMAVLGRRAKSLLEGDKPDRVNAVTHAPDADAEILHVAAGATAWMENRQRTAANASPAKELVNA